MKYRIRIVCKRIIFWIPALIVMLACKCQQEPPIQPPTTDPCQAGQYTGPATPPTGGCIACRAGGGETAHARCKRCCDRTGGPPNGGTCDSYCVGTTLADEAGLGPNDLRPPAEQRMSILDAVSDNLAHNLGSVYTSSAPDELLANIPPHVMQLLQDRGYELELANYIYGMSPSRRESIETALGYYSPEQWQSLLPLIAASLDSAPVILAGWASALGLDPQDPQDRFRVYDAWIDSTLNEVYFSESMCTPYMLFPRTSSAPN